MRIESIRIQNLRSVKDVTVNLDPFTTFVGPNGAGKSTVLCALNVFFRAADDVATSMTSLDAEDFHLRNTDVPIEITLTFGSLSEAAEDRLSHYVRNGKLVVTAIAEFDESKELAAVRHFGQRLGIPQIAKFFGAVSEKAKVGDLREVYNELREEFTELPSETTGPKMTAALEEFEAQADPSLFELIPSPADFYGSAPTAGLLRPFIEWVYIPAVKDASSEATEGDGIAFKKLISRRVSQKDEIKDEIDELRKQTHKKYMEILDDKKSALDELSARLGQRLAHWSHPGVQIELDWKDDPDKAVRMDLPQVNAAIGEGGFVGDVSRQGHGMQRSYLIALLEELAQSDLPDAPTLAIGIEEPELYQHPPQARRLARVLEELSEGDAQIVVTTHSPYFITGRGFESVRMVRKASSGESTVDHASAAAVNKRIRELHGDDSPLATNHETGAIARLHQALTPELNEMFFSQRVVLVEGSEDVAYIRSWIAASGREERFQESGWHIVPTNNKSNIIRPKVVAELLGIQTFIVADCDCSPANKEKAKENGVRKQHENDNRALARTAGLKLDDAFPAEGVSTATLRMWPDNIGTTFDQEISESLGTDEFTALNEKVRLNFGQVKGLEKNALFIQSVVAAVIDAGGTCASLDELCESLLAPAS